MTQSVNFPQAYELWRWNTLPWHLFLFLNSSHFFLSMTWLCYHDYFSSNTFSFLSSVKPAPVLGLLSAACLACLCWLSFGNPSALSGHLQFLFSPVLTATHFLGFNLQLPLVIGFWLLSQTHVLKGILQCLENSFPSYSSADTVLLFLIDPFWPHSTVATKLHVTLL